jgi:hypothetical protein
MTESFPAIDARETKVLTFDASSELADGETLTSIKGNVDVSLLAGSDDNAAHVISSPLITQEDVTVGTRTIAAKHAVQAIVSGMKAGCRYLIAITCNTSNAANVPTLKGELPVSSN